MKNKLYDMKFMVYLPFVVSVIATIFLLFFLPTNMPMQFAGDGSVNWSLNKYIGVWMIPLIGFLICKGYEGAGGLDFRTIILAWTINLLNVGFLSYIAFFM